MSWCSWSPSWSSCWPSPVVSPTCSTISVTRTEDQEPALKEYSRISSGSCCRWHIQREMKLIFCFHCVYDVYDGFILKCCRSRMSTTDLKWILNLKHQNTHLFYVFEPHFNNFLLWVENVEIVKHLLSTDKWKSFVENLKLIHTFSFQPFRGNPGYDEVTDLPFSTSCLSSLTANKEEINIKSISTCRMETMYNSSCINEK